jgi:hypothetical protein
MNKNNAGLVIAVLLIGTALLNDPRCTRGCRTVAEHLFSHALDEFIAGLF